MRDLRKAIKDLRKTCVSKTGIIGTPSYNEWLEHKDALKHSNPVSAQRGWFDPFPIRIGKITFHRKFKMSVHCWRCWRLPFDVNHSIPIPDYRKREVGQ
jgi:hypothetical protein